jgi:hypothetical protein
MKVAQYLKSWQPLGTAGALSEYPGLKRWAQGADPVLPAL